MPINPYLHFNGTCREAMTTYKSILGGQLDMMGFAQMPEAPPDYVASDRVMHSALMSPHGDIQASDHPPGRDGGPQASVDLHVQLPTMAEGRRVYDALEQGGAIIMPFGPSFFSPGFAMLVDRFGTHWIISVTPGG